MTRTRFIIAGIIVIVVYAIFVLDIPYKKTDIQSTSYIQSTTTGALPSDL